MTTTRGVRRLLAAALSALVSASLLLGGMTPASSATPTEPTPFNVRWFVEDRSVILTWNEPTVAPDGYEVVTEVDGEEQSRERLAPGSLWNRVFLGWGPAGTPVRVSVRELRGVHPGTWESFVALIGATAPGPVDGIQAESLPHDDVLRLQWAPPAGAAGEELDYHVSLTKESNGSGTVDYLVDGPRLEVITEGVGVELYAEVTSISSGGYGHTVRQRVVYEDVPGQATEINPRPRAGGFNLKWQYGRGNQATSWEVLVDGVVVPAETRPGASRFLLADVTGLETGTDYVVGVRGVNEHGVGDVLTTTARTYDLPDQLAAPRVKRGPRGGDLSVRVSWTPPADWGGGEECCYRITGHGPADRAGVPALVVRWSDAPATRFDFPVGRPGKWRFQVEAKTGAGFSPISEPSRWVRAR